MNLYKINNKSLNFKVNLIIVYSSGKIIKKFYKIPKEILENFAEKKRLMFDRKD